MIIMDIIVVIKIGVTIMIMVKKIVCNEPNYMSVQMFKGLNMLLNNVNVTR